MGYTTTFEGQFKLNTPLTPAQCEYLRKFATTRRVGRDVTKLPPDPVREAVGLPVGVEGEFFVGGDGAYGQDNDESVLDYNTAPAEQPGLWCQWTPSKDGTAIVWDEGEKFYCYVEWLEYLIVNMLIPWGHVINGNVTYQGESAGIVVLSLFAIILFM